MAHEEVRLRLIQHETRLGLREDDENNEGNKKQGTNQKEKIAVCGETIGLTTNQNDSTRTLRVQRRVFANKANGSKANEPQSDSKDVGSRLGVHKDTQKGQHLSARRECSKIESK